MYKRGYFAVPVALVSCLTHAATLVGIDESNFSTILANMGQQTLTTHQADNQFKLFKSVTLSNGKVKNKYIQYYKDVPIFSPNISVTSTQGALSKPYGAFLEGISLDLENVTPALSSTDAISKIKLQQKNLTQKNSVENEEAKLYIIQDKQTQKARLVYLVSLLVTDTQMPSRPRGIVDAHTGEILDQWDGLTTREAQGPGGNEKFGGYYYGRDYASLEVSDSCEMKTANVETYNMNGAERGEVLFKFDCPENTFKEINGAYSPLNDAHYFGNVVFQMYDEWFGIAPITQKLKLRVHYGRNFENAFWDGRQMTFGDGASRMYPLTSLDVVSHEVSHGVTEQNSDLIYKHQSGGINEAFSDMAGEAAEYYMLSQNGLENDWLVGASIIKGSADKAMRYFEDPTRDGYSIGHAKDYHDALDVHFTSGVYNKAFYTLAHKKDWDIKKAFEVFLVANQVYWKANATFESAACGVKKAAEDLDYNSDDIVSSFEVVGVNASCEGAPDPTPSPIEKRLENGQVVENLKIEKDQELRFVLSVPSLPWYPYRYDFFYAHVFTSSIPASDLVELFVRYDSEENILDRSPQLLNNEEFYISFPNAGDYHILLKGKQQGQFNFQALYGNNR